MRKVNGYDFEIYLIPFPKKLEVKDGTFLLSSNRWVFSESVDIGTSLVNFLEKEGISYRFGRYKSPNLYYGDIFIGVNPYVVPHKEGYKLFMDDYITILGHDERGLFYGVQTLKQLIRQFGKKIPKLFIEDYPDFPNRGIMIDISRDRVPKLDTLKYIIDKLSELKINQVQLYMEHTFAYKEHEEVWKDYSPLTHEEIIELDKYCKQRYVELVPNQNTFGHMSKWLVHEKYKHLAESPEGYETPWGGRYEYPFSLSPAVPESEKFVEEILDELLPLFSSEQVNVGCDETFDLGVGKSKELCERYGKGKVYFDFLMKIYKIAKKHKESVMFWGDIIENHPEFIRYLPKDMIPMVWGYEADHPYEEKCGLYADSGLSFYVCPGTSTWNTFVGRADNAVVNIKNAIFNGKKYGAIGVLTTDWGDNGHVQHLPFSWIGFSYSAEMSWNVSEVNIDKFLKALDINIFEVNPDEYPIAELIHKLGIVHNKLFYTPNGTPFFYAFLYPERNGNYKLELEKIKEVENDVLSLRKEIQKFRSDEDSKLSFVVDQILNNIDFALLGLKVMKFLSIYKDIQAVPENEWMEFEDEFNKVIESYRRIWLVQNRPGGLEQSIYKLSRILRVRRGDLRGLIF